MIRRLYRPALPALTHWFGIRGGDLHTIPDAELAAYLRALSGLPPIGGAYLYETS